MLINKYTTVRDNTSQSQKKCLKSIKMKWCLNFHYIVVLFLLCIVLFVTADITEIRKNAIKRLDAAAADIRKLAEETSIEVDKRQDNIKIITKHEREFGDGIKSNIVFQISKTARSAYMMANLLGSSNEVFRCIEYREREAVEESDKYYSTKFLDPGRDYETRAEQYQRNLIKSWKDDYYKAIDQYANIYKKAVADIQKSTSESYISSVVKQFDQTTKQMADIILNIHPNMAKIHIQILTVLNQLVSGLQQFAKYRVEETTKAIDKCFPRLLQTEYFFPNLLL